MDEDSDRGKHAGGRDAAGATQVEPRHAGSPDADEQPESGTVREPRSADQLSPDEEEI